MSLEAALKRPPRPSKAAWLSFVTRYGEHEARRKLRWVSRPPEKVSAQAEIRHHRVRREGLSLVADLVHRWPGLSPMEARKKFAVPIRDMLRVLRERRERIREFCAPGVSRQTLP